MRRRQFLASIICGASASISGCLNDPGAEGGVVEALEVENPPNATITEASDERIASIDPIQQALQKASDHSTATVSVSEREYETVAQALSELPWYERTQDHSSNPRPSGIYIRYKNESYVVVLNPFCADSVIRNAQGERGEYSWGGCIER